MANKKNYSKRDCTTYSNMSFNHRIRAGFNLAQGAYSEDNVNPEEQNSASLSEYMVEPGVVVSLVSRNEARGLCQKLKDTTVSKKLLQT
ncbi:MAG: hypothetical protein AABX30_00550 [Nanoarchaeota archaeon]|mgnify:CR=1 FL=1